MKPPPPVIDGARVLWWADTAGIARTDACTFREGDRDQTSFAALAIARDDDASGCYLFLCDDQWETQNDTDHRTIEEARGFADSLYPGIANRWKAVPAPPPP
jgi:hypothetical protein